MSAKGKVVHKQQFQNAQQIIEVVVKSKPKAKLGLKTKSKSNQIPYVRDCLLKKGIDMLAKEEEEKRLKIKSKKMNKERPMPKLKINQPRTTLEIHKKSKKKREKRVHDILPECMTWGEFLSNISSSNTSDTRVSLSDNSPNSLSEDNHFNFATKTLRKINNQKKVHKDQTDIPEKYRNENMDIPNQYRNENMDIPKNYRNAKIDVPQRYKNANMAPKNPKPELRIPQDPMYERDVLKKDNAYKTSEKTPSTNICKPIHVNRSIQTSFVASSNKSPHNQIELQENLPRSNRTLTEQTHSPFGESAIKLLHHLRERLRSIGDSEGSEMVNAIEAYFGSAESKSGNKHGLSVPDSASPVFAPVFHREKSTVPSNDAENENLKKVIAEQEKRLEKQDEIIQELKTLSAGLLAYHEQLAQQIIQSAHSTCKGNAITDKVNNLPKKAEDSGIELSSSEDLQKALKLLTSERDAFLKEVKNQREIILSLEVKLSQTEKELGSGKRHRPAMQRLSPAAAEDCYDTQKKNAKSSQERIAQNPNFGHSLCHTNNDSDADSAYEDKSCKSSRPTSKASSNVHNKNQTSKNNGFSIQRNEPALSSRFHQGGVSDSKVLSEVETYCNNKANRGVENYVPMSEAVGCITTHEPIPRKDGKLTSPSKEISMSILSDVSTDHHTNFVTLESDYRQRKSDAISKRTMLSETPVFTPDLYLESTHVSDKKKTDLTATKPSVSKRVFEPQLSFLESGTFEESKMAPVLFDS